MMENYARRMHMGSGIGAEGKPRSYGSHGRRGAVDPAMKANQRVLKERKPQTVYTMLAADWSVARRPEHELIVRLRVNPRPGPDRGVMGWKAAAARVGLEQAGKPGAGLSADAAVYFGWLFPGSRGRDTDAGPCCPCLNLSIRNKQNSVPQGNDKLKAPSSSLRYCRGQEFDSNPYVWAVRAWDEGVPATAESCLGSPSRALSDWQRAHTTSDAARVQLRGKGHPDSVNEQS